MTVALGIALLATLLGVGYLIQRGERDRLARVEAVQLAEQARARRDALERAAQAELEARRSELNEKVSQVRDSAGAARLLREQLSRRRPR